MAPRRSPVALAALAAAAVAAAEPLASRACSDARWQKLHAALSDAFHSSTYSEAFSPDIYQLTDPDSFEWYKENYQDCVEGLLSLVLYLSFHSEGSRLALLDLADKTARELNPLALRSGLSTWPLFGLLSELHLVWQAGDRVAPLATEPWRLAPCAEPAPGMVSPLLAALTAGGAEASPMRLARALRPGSLLIDAGVFDGTDWALAGVVAGATVLGFEPLSENHRLIENRFPLALAKTAPEAGVTPTGRQSRRYTVLPVQPGEPAPRIPWVDVFPPREQGSGPGHAFIVGAALGERVKALNMTTRYDYSSVADQGYLSGPKNMRREEVAMTTLDAIFSSYLAANGAAPSAHIDVLKLDVEGYEMGALRGAERLLAEGRVHYLVLEFHPGMLGSTGTDPRGLLDFLRHYCFLCHSLKIDRPHSFDDFVARYTSSREMLPLQGLGALEDLVCQNLWWQPPGPLTPVVPLSTEGE